MCFFGARWSRHGSGAIAHHKEVPGSCGGCWGGGRRGGIFQESQALDYPRKEEVTSAHLSTRWRLLPQVDRAPGSTLPLGAPRSSQLFWHLGVYFNTHLAKLRAVRRKSAITASALFTSDADVNSARRGTNFKLRDVRGCSFISRN